MGGTNTDIVYSYNNFSSVVSSTTNNYYGIYDMAGGAWEYVMGVMLDENGKLASGLNNTNNSNFVGTLTSDNKEWTIEDGGLPWPDSKYYDTYEYATTSQQFQRGLLGDGTKEFGPFYSVVYKTGSEDATISRQVNEWNAGDAFLVSRSTIWFRRGGDITCGLNASPFSFNNYGGQAYGILTFRVVLTP